MVVVACCCCCWIYCRCIRILEKQRALRVDVERGVSSSFLLLPSFCCMYACRGWMTGRDGVPSCDPCVYYVCQRVVHSHDHRKSVPFACCCSSSSFARLYASHVSRPPD